MKKLRFISVLLLVCLCIGMFSCKKENNEEIQSSDISETDNTPVENDYITIAENKKANYQIVYPSNTTETVRAEVEDIFSVLKTISGAVPTLHDDYLADGKSFDKEAQEILIGKTEYPETKQVLSEIGYGEWKICVKGNKLVVAAYSEHALQDAITKLIMEWKKVKTEDGAIKLPVDFSLSSVKYEVANHLPTYVGGTVPEIVDSGDDTVLAIINDTKLTEYDKYLAKLEAIGYTYYTSNKIGENCFATYYNDTHLIHAGYYSYENAVRVTIEKKTTVGPLKSENVYTANLAVTTSLAQFGLSTAENDYTNIGMAYVIQLSDGSFIVIDGGYTADAERLYNYMKSKAVDGNIVIASWFVSHNHTDHTKCIENFATNYKDKAKIEQVVLNFPAVYTGTEEIGAQIAIKEIPDCRVIKAHTGQKFFIRNAEIEILFSLDSFYPQSLSNLNNSSLVIAVNVENERILFTADISDEPMEILVDMYGDYLKCDILQLAHHGQRNSRGLDMPNTIKAYQIMRPSLVLWPTSEENYLDDSLDDIYLISKHQWNLEACNSAREVYIAGGDYVTVFELPYKYYSAQKIFINQEQ